MYDPSNAVLARIALRLAREEGLEHVRCLRPTSGEVHLVTDGEKERVLRIAATNAGGYVLREAAALTCLAEKRNIPVPKLYSVKRFTSGGWPGTYLIREFKRGRPLERGEGLTDEQLFGLACLVDEVHEAGVSSLDLRPDNLLVTPEGSIGLFEFTEAALRSGVAISGLGMVNGCEGLYATGRSEDRRRYAQLGRRNL